MRFQSTRYCPQGHDKDAPHGKDSAGRCGVCKRVRDRRHRAARRLKRAIQKAAGIMEGYTGVG